MLSGRFWPYHPKPQADEALSSWVLRTAFGHGQKPYAFCNAVWPRRPILTRDIDNLSDAVLVDTMAARTGTPRDRAVGTTLGALEGRLFERHLPTGRTKWILRAGIRHRNWENAGLQFCPRCLAADALPYIRRAWRLALNAVCPQHGAILLDRCPDCGSTVMPHRSPALHVCCRCGFDLRGAETVSGTFRAIVLHRANAAILARGWAHLAEYTMRSHLYFDLLHQVIRLLSTGRRSDRLRDFVSSHWGGDPRPPAYGNSSRELEALSPSDRHRLFDLASILLEGWPFRFVAACAEVGIRHALATRDAEDLPFAYVDPVRYHLYRPFYVPSETEVLAGISYLQAQGVEPSGRALSGLFGDSQTIRMVRRDQASRQVDADLEASESGT